VAWYRDWYFDARNEIATNALVSPFVDFAGILGGTPT
jgi:hypothetical protein